MASKGTAPFVLWRDLVIGLAGVSVPESKQQRERLSLWFEHGETAESAAKMLKLFSQPAIKPVTPLSCAVKHFRDGRRVA